MNEDDGGLEIGMIIIILIVGGVVAFIMIRNNKTAKAKPDGAVCTPKEADKITNGSTYSYKSGECVANTCVTDYVLDAYGVCVRDCSAYDDINDISDDSIKLECFPQCYAADNSLLSATDVADVNQMICGFGVADTGGGADTGGAVPPCGSGGIESMLSTEHASRCGLITSDMVDCYRAIDQTGVEAGLVKKGVDEMGNDITLARKCGLVGDKSNDCYIWEETGFRERLYAEVADNTNLLEACHPVTYAANRAASLTVEDPVVDGNTIAFTATVNTTATTVDLLLADDTPVKDFGEQNTGARIQFTVNGLQDGTYSYKFRARKNDSLVEIPTPTQTIDYNEKDRKDKLIFYSASDATGDKLCKIPLAGITIGSITSLDAACLSRGTLDRNGEEYTINAMSVPPGHRVTLHTKHGTDSLSMPEGVITGISAYGDIGDKFLNYTLTKADTTGFSPMDTTDGYSTAEQTDYVNVPVTATTQNCLLNDVKSHCRKLEDCAGISFTYQKTINGQGMGVCRTLAYAGIDNDDNMTVAPGTDFYKKVIPTQTVGTAQVMAWPGSGTTEWEAAKNDKTNEIYIQTPDFTKTGRRFCKDQRPDDSENMTCLVGKDNTEVQYNCTIDPKKFLTGKTQIEWVCKYNKERAAQQSASAIAATKLAAVDEPKYVKLLDDIKFGTRMELTGDDGVLGFDIESASKACNANFKRFKDSDPAKACLAVADGGNNLWSGVNQAGAHSATSKEGASVWVPNGHNSVILFGHTYYNAVSAPERAAALTIAEKAEMAIYTYDENNIEVDVTATASKLKAANEGKVVLSMIVPNGITVTFDRLREPSTFGTVSITGPAMIPDMRKISESVGARGQPGSIEVLQGSAGVLSDTSIASARITKMTIATVDASMNPERFMIRKTPFLGTIVFKDGYSNIIATRDVKTSLDATQNSLNQYVDYVSVPAGYTVELKNAGGSWVSMGDDGLVDRDMYTEFDIKDGDTASRKPEYAARYGDGGGCTIQ